MVPALPRWPADDKSKGIEALRTKVKVRETQAAASELTVSQLVDYLISTSTGLPRDRKRELYALMNDYVTTFVPIQNRVLATLDLPRYYDVQPYVRDARKAGRRLTAAVNRMIAS